MSIEDVRRQRGLEEVALQRRMEQAQAILRESKKNMKTAELSKLEVAVAGAAKHYKVSATKALAWHLMGQIAPALGKEIQAVLDNMEESK